MINKDKQTSVIKRMYVGFTVMVLLFIATVMLMLNGTSQIHQQLQSVNSNALPLVTLANQTSVKLLIADKIFKDFLTSQETEKMLDYEGKFSLAQQDFNISLSKLANQSANNNALNNQLNELLALETRYFSESNNAMMNYKAQLNAQQERQKTARRFQKLQTDLRLGMIKYINEKGTDTVKLLAKGYFDKLKLIETTTSDALASDDISVISKAMKANKRSVTRLKFSYQAIVTQMPSFKEEFGISTDQFIQDAGKKGGVLDQHFSFITARSHLYASISVLAIEIDQAMLILNTFRDEADQIMTHAIITASDIYDDGYVEALIMSGCVSFFLIFLAWLLAQNVRKPLISILNALEELTDGNMTQRVSGNTFIEFNQLSSHINTLASNLQDILRQLSITSGDLAKVSEQNQSTMSSSKARLNEQRNQTASVATAMTEMQHSVQDVATSAQNSLDKVHEVEEATHVGRKVMSDNITTIQLLSDNLDESVKVVATVQEMSADIGSILDVIRHIAAQTNLLALNAAIEAARAGEQGRGFAVVADEVRVLAKRTTNSTAEIEDMIKNLQSKSEHASKVMQSCVSEMAISLNQTSKTNQTMEGIQENIIEISKMSYHIAHAAEEQNLTTNNIAHSLEDISQIADDNNLSMELVAEVSAQLDELAHQQNELVNQFKV